MDGSVIIVLLLTSYMIYVALSGDPLKIENTTVPRQYYTQYREYLQSAEWKQLRHMRAIVDFHRCIRCGATSSLQCHHIHYDGIETMSFFLSQLETVCRSCHTKIHKGKLPMSHTK